MSDTNPVPVPHAEGPLGVSGNDKNPDLGGFPVPPAPAVGSPDRQTAAWLQSAAALSLDRLPASEPARALVQTLDGLLKAHDAATRRRQRGQQGRAKRLDAVGRIVGAILAEWSREPARPIYSSMKPASFTGRAVPYRQFLAVVEGLTQMGLLNTVEGKQLPPTNWGEGVTSWQGFATRFWPTSTLLRHAAASGLSPDSTRKAFARQVVSGGTGQAPTQPVRLTGLRERKGRREQLPVPAGDETATQLRREVEDANALAAACSVVGCAPPRWSRVFTADWRLGGRWIAQGYEGNYQQMAEEDRLAITIDGQAVAELDVSASHLSIMHGLLRLPLPDGDLYGFDGLPRPVVKAWITATLGKGSALVKWSNRAEAQTPEVANFKAKEVGAAVRARYGFLAAPAKAVEAAAGLDAMRHLGPPERLLTHRLMGIEAAAMTRAMLAVMQRGEGRTVLAMPVHDSLIVPASVRNFAASCIVLAFTAQAGVTVRVHAG